MLNEFRSTSITWDKATRRIYSPITANASDSNGRKLNIQVVNSGQVENLTGATLHLYWETKDKAQYGLDAFAASDISKGEFEIFYTTAMLSNVGELNATLVLVDATGKVVSDWFKITVARGIDNNAIQSENSFSSLTQALIDISDLEQNYAPRLNDLTAQLAQTDSDMLLIRRNSNTNKTTFFSFIDDDGAIECWTKMKPLFDSKGVVGGMAIIPAAVGAANFMSQPQIKTLEDNGWEVLGHDSQQLTLYADNEVENVLINTKTSLGNMGFTVKNWVYPGGAYNKRIADLARKHYESSMLTDRGNGELSYNTMPIDLGVTKRYEIRSDRDLAHYQSVVDQAMSKGNVWVIFYFHTFYAEFDSISPLIGNLIDYIKSKNAEIVTPQTALKVFGNAINVGDKLIDADYTKVSKSGVLDAKLKNGYALGDLQYIITLPENSKLGTDLMSTYPIGCSVCSIRGGFSSTFPNNGTGRLTTLRNKSENGWGTQTYRAYGSITVYERVDLGDGSWSPWVKRTDSNTFEYNVCTGQTIVAGGSLSVTIPTTSIPFVMGYNDTISANPHAGFGSIPYTVYIQYDGSVVVRFFNVKTTDVVLPSSQTWYFRVVKNN